MRKVLRRFWRDSRGISSIEYAMLAVGIALAIFVGAQVIGNSINSGLSNIGGQITNDV